MNDTIIAESRQNLIAELVAARTEQGMSQQALANMLGMQRSGISRIERGAQNVSLDTVLRMAAALGKEVALSDALRPASGPEPETYSLRLFDEELLTFSLRRAGLEGLKAHIESVNEARRDVLPLDLELADEGVLHWLENRIIPKNREFVDEILKTLGLGANDTKGIIDVCKGLSLNDSYWVVPVGFEGTFAEYNLYENRFSNVLALVAYTGAGGSREAFTTSPELTTHGMLRKAWRFIEDDGIYLYKGGTSGFANAGREPYSEYYACQVAERMGLRAVHYELEQWKGILASKCRLFTDIHTSYVPIGRIVRTGGLAACLAWFAAIDEEAAEEVRSMLVFDAVIYNEDRHFGNFGVLRDSESGHLIGPAPLFDHGMSLFNYAMEEDFVRLDEYAKTRTTPYGVSFEDVCREVMGPRQKAQLRKLIGFRFTRHPSFNLPEEHLEAIERHLQKRVRQLLMLGNE